MVKLKVFFETFGCTSNQADTEIMKGLVRKRHIVVGSQGDSEVVVINSCGVIEHTQRKVIKSARKATSEGKKVVLAGCLSRIDPGSIAESGADSTIAPDSLDLINQALDAASNGGSIISSSKPVDKAFLGIAEGHIIAAIPIAEGCLGSCSYCATRNARGRLRSFSAEAIKDTVTRAIAKGTKEIQLTAQDTGIYGMDIGSSLAVLINAICEIDGDFRVRVGMMNPAHVSPILDDLIEAYQDEKVYKFLHLPLQSGDDELLDQMHRGYTVGDFTAIVARFREAFSELTLSTDVIIGYPRETKKSFSKTIRLIEEIAPDVLNITRFSPRPNTEAAQLKDMPDRIKKERSRVMSAIAKDLALERNKKYVGKDMDVLITQHGKNGTLLARTDAYKQVVLKQGKIGDFTRITINGATPHYLIGV